MSRSAHAIAYANIAVSKYWGKSDVVLNLPAVPSLSLTLAPLSTRTTVTFDTNISADEMWLDDVYVEGKALGRASKLLDQVRLMSGVRDRARVRTRNNFPTASGLASSASGFAALAGAATSALDLTLSLSEISAMARQASASAARSVFGGWVMLERGLPGDSHLAAFPVEAASAMLDVRMVVAVVQETPKSHGSTDAMEHTRHTSPYFEAWVQRAPGWFTQAKEALIKGDLQSLGEVMELNTMAMHATAMAAKPGILYWKPATLAILHEVQQLRTRDGIGVWATMDAGPHVKAMCHVADAQHVASQLEKVPGVLRTIVAEPGPGLYVEKL